MNELADTLVWLTLLIVPVLAALAGLMTERAHTRPQPFLLQRDAHGPRTMATVRYANDVGDSA
jgi:hypothetical protein